MRSFRERNTFESREGDRMVFTGPVCQDPGQGPKFASTRVARETRDLGKQSSTCRASSFCLTWPATRPRTSNGDRPSQHLADVELPDLPEVGMELLLLRVDDQVDRDVMALRQVEADVRSVTRIHEREHLGD